MPYIIRPRGVQKIAAALFSTVLLIGAVPAVASAACPTLPQSEALAKFGDTSSYGLLSGSSFESGAEGWSLNDAEVVGGEGANGSSGSLVIDPRGSAVSPAFCVSSEYPSFRFFAHQVGRGYSGGSLNVSLRWTNPDGSRQEASVGSIRRGSHWTLSPVMELAGALPLSEATETLEASVVFRPSFGSSWAIDDVYIDPYSR